jgi:hypothetical protein
MAKSPFVLCHWLLTILTFALVWLHEGHVSEIKRTIEFEHMYTWNRFLDFPGRVSSLFSPTLRDPSLMLLDVEVKGSGAATLDSFCEDKSQFNKAKPPEVMAHRFTFLADHACLR